MADADLALEVAKLRNELAAFGGALAVIEARLIALEARPATEQPAQPADQQPAIIIPARRLTNEQQQRADWIAQLPCHSCKHPVGVDVRHAIANDVLSEHQCSPSGLPLCCCRVVHSMRNNTERTWVE